MTTRAMLMAAGLGTRLRPFTDVCPKALLPLMGVPAAQFAIDSLRDAGVEMVVANVHHHAQAARAGLLALDRDPIKMQISDESDLLMGSAGALKKAELFFDNDAFFLVNADVLCGIDLHSLAREHRRMRALHGVTITLAVFEASPVKGRYREIFLDRSSGLPSGLIEGLSPDLREDRPFFIGSAVIEPEALALVSDDGPSEFVPKVLEPAIRGKKAAFFLTKGVWRDIGTPAHWLEAHLYLIRAMETGQLPLRWRRRLEEKILRIAEGVWAPREFEKSARLAQREGRLAGPSFFSSPDPVAALGPSAVLYGAAQEIAAPLSFGIGYGGHWAKSDAF